MCQPCYNKSWFDSHPDYQRVRYAASLEASRASVAARQAKRKASCKGLTPHPATPAQRAALVAPGEMCLYCDVAQAVHVDHFIPIARWNEVQLTAQQRADGPNHISNLVGACAACNLSKNDRLPDVEWRGRGDQTMTTEKPWVQTYTGRAFDLLDPKPEQIDPLDIAHALSNLCRFTGHVREFYSVAQHSCLVAEIARDLWDGPQPCPAVVCLAALLHDAAEAYIGDVSTPLKRALRGEGSISEYDAIERGIEQAIDLRFGVFGSPGRINSAHALIKRADLIALATEHAQLFTGPPPRSWGLELPDPWPYKITPWPPAMAQVQFLQAFRFYGGGQ